MQIWECKIGEVDESKLPSGSDYPMRQAIAKAYREITGQFPEFLFSGWGAELNECQRSIVEEVKPCDV